MSNRVIYCPGPGAWVPIGAYVRGVKLAKANPDREFQQGITTWYPVTGREIMRQFYRGVEDRINQGIPYSQRGMARQ